MTREQSGQRGFNLVDFMTAFGIIAIVLSTLVGLFWNEVRGSATARVAVAASSEIDNACRSLSQDCIMAQSSDLIDEAAPVDQLTLTWTEWYNLTAAPHVSTYWLSGTDLKRDYDGTVTTVARNISSVTFSQTGRVITVVVASTPPWVPAKTVERTLRVWLRPLE